MALLIPVLNLNHNSFRTSVQFLLNDHRLIISCNLYNTASITVSPELLAIHPVHVHSRVMSTRCCGPDLLVNRDGFVFVVNTKVPLSYLLHLNDQSPSLWQTRGKDLVDEG